MGELCAGGSAGEQPEGQQAAGGGGFEVVEAAVCAEGGAGDAVDSEHASGAGLAFVFARLGEADECVSEGGILAGQMRSDGLYSKPP